MGLIAASLSGHRVTSARASIPAWGCWYADASVDGEVTLSGAVDLVIADLTLKGAVLSGGPAKGRSHFRIVGGSGGWGRVVRKESYANDAGVKLSTVLGDVSRLVGETVDLGSRSSERVGPSWVRPSEPAARVLELVAPGAWYVDEAGVTRLGKRTTTTLSQASVTHGPVDLARATVTLAAESIAAILPGVTVDGLEAVDVQHDISEKGLRSTIWGRLGSPTSRRLATLRALADQLDPDRKFRGVTAYRVVTVEGKRLNLQPIRVSTGMPDLRRVRINPGVGGADVAPTLGSTVLVGFVDTDPARPVVLAFEDAEGEGFAPATLNFKAGGQVGGERLMTVEATALLIYNVMVALMAAAGGGPLLAVVLQPLLGAAINAALEAQAVPAPPTAAAQQVTAAALLAGFATGVTPSNTSAFFTAAIGSLDLKTPNASGLFPSLGCAAVKGG